MLLHHWRQSDQPEQARGSDSNYPRVAGRHDGSCPQQARNADFSAGGITDQCGARPTEVRNRVRRRRYPSCQFLGNNVSIKRLSSETLGCRPTRGLLMRLMLVRHDLVSEAGAQPREFPVHQTPSSAVFGCATALRCAPQAPAGFP